MILIAQLALASTALLLATGASVPSPRQVIEAKFEAVNRHAIPEIVAFYGEDAVLTASDFCGPRHGKTEVQRTYQGIFAAVPDVRADVIELVEQDDRVAVRVVLRSRQPGRAFDLPLMNFFTVRHGKIVRDDGVFDNGGRACRR